jgi:hypothetical protein
MKLHALAAILAAATFGAASAYAGDAPIAKKQPFEKLDKDKDGFLGHSEAAADRDAASRFDELDTNGDEKVSRAEYDAWQTSGSSSAAGASGTAK